MKTSHVVPFYFNENEVRTLTIDNEPWFVAKDVCDILDLSNVGEALRPLGDDELTSEILMSGGQRREMKFVSESGLYRLIFRSNKPEAEVFRKWVFTEVLPTIRKTGSYSILQGDKRVFVNHSHKKDSRAPGGLDIRYTLDLGKIVARPTRSSIELLERLTGIQLTDIPLGNDDNTELIAEQVKTFCQDCCRFTTGGKIAFAKVYDAYRRHCSPDTALPMMAASRKRFSSLMAAAGYSSARMGGTVFFIDLELVEKEVL